MSHNTRMLGAPPGRAILTARAVILPRLPPPPSAGVTLGRLGVAIRDARVVVGFGTARLITVEAAAGRGAVAA